MNSSVVFNRSTVAPSTLSTSSVFAKPTSTVSYSPIKYSSTIQPTVFNNYMSSSKDKDTFYPSKSMSKTLSQWNTSYVSQPIPSNY